jgi:tetratricopeptide (TPR) repeat protein
VNIRLRVGGACVLVVVCGALAALAMPILCMADEPVVLTAADHSISLAGGQTITLQVDVRRMPVVVLVEQRGIDVVVMDGIERVPHGAPTGAWGPEPLILGKAADALVSPKLATSPAGDLGVRALVPRNEAELRFWTQWAEATRHNARGDAQGQSEALRLLLAIDASAIRYAPQHVVALRVGVAALQRRLNEPEAALAAYSRALAAADNDPGWRARIHNGRGLAYRALEDFVLADREFASAERLGRQAEDDYEWTSAKNNRCLILQHRGQLSLAQDCYRDAIATYRKAGQGEHVAVGLLNLAAVYDQSGEPDRALAIYDEALQMRRAGKDKLSLGAVLTNMAIAEVGVGRWQSALQHIDESATHFKAIGDKGRLLRAWLVQSSIYRSLREPRRAQFYAKRAVELAKRIGDSSGFASARSELAQLVEARRAVEIHLDVLRHWAATGQAVSEAQELLRLATRRLELDQFDQAAHVLDRAQRLSEAKGFDPILAEVHLLSARLALAQGDRGSALARAQVARDEMARLRDPHGRAEAEAIAARALIDQGQVAAARTLIDESIKRLHRDQQSPASPLLKSNLADRHDVLTGMLFDLLLAPSNPSTADVELAMAVRWTDPVIHSALPSVSDANLTLIEELRAKVLLLGAAGRRADTRVRAALVTRIEEIEMQLDLNEVAGVETAIDSIGLESLAAAMPMRTGVMATACGSTSCSAIVIWRGAWSIVRLPDWPQLEPDVKAVAESREAGSSESWLRLSQAMLPLIPVLDGLDRIALLSDARMRHIPFAAMRMQDGTYWIERMEFARLGRLPSNPQTLRSTLLKKGFQLHIWASDDSPPPKASGLERLTATRYEVDLIQASLPAERVRQIGLGSTAVDVGQGSVILHIAAHGLASMEHPRASTLALTESSMGNADNPLDGVRLVGPERLIGLSHAPDLVFLNACETSVGRDGAGTGTNLAQGFIDQGAGAVISTQWPIGDHAAAHFAKAYYKALVTAPGVGDAIAALATAQRAVLGTRSGRRPQSWAGYEIFLSQ